MSPKSRTKSPDERSNERLVTRLHPARSHIPCPKCESPMSWECKPEVIKRGGFPVSTDTFWGKIWCNNCGLVWEACPWPRAGVPVQTVEPFEKGPNPYKKYHGGKGNLRT